MIAFAAAATAVQVVMSGGLVPIFSALVGAFTGVLAASGAFQKSFDELGGIISGVLNEFGKALSTLAPVAQPFLQFIGDMGKLLAGTVASYSNLFASLAPEIGAITAAALEFKNALVLVITAFQGTSVAIFSTAIQNLAFLMARAAPYVGAFARIVGNLVENIIRWTSSLFGITIPDLKAPKGEVANNFGAAAKSTSTGSVEDVLRRARESAFSLGTGSSKPEDKTAANTDAINKAIREQQAKIDALVTAAQGTWEDIKTLPEKVEGYLSAAASIIVQAINKIVPTAPSVPALPAIPGVGGATVEDVARELRRRLGI